MHKPTGSHLATREQLVRSLLILQDSANSENMPALAEMYGESADMLALEATLIEATERLRASKAI